jgi:hypothetical protein
MMEEVSKYLRTSAVVLMPVFWLAAIVLVLNFTSPIVAGPTGILVVFLLFYCFSTSTIYVLLRGVLAASKFFGRKDVLRRRQSAYVSSVIALGPVFLVALNTLGQIGLVEIVLVVALVGLGSFYVIRRGAE